ncbi:quinone oxidoreductase family protein [Leptothoe sp. PORK10 BA2]|uniref:quinone oxidoreductase family protein n=1 Tax=Leptothoe sp. PORK10 BA2 TaxID=3110254 RepID=UPI002B213DDC|nr:zinc-binding dehydrogenase [Leptothoe sp. PORK10 BA2]MEA5464700.1 zinc-binding dehydrogenase [Leptothoe sp. PORK10 BA2]
MSVVVGLRPLKACRIHQYQGPESVQVEQVDLPEPGPDQVRIRVRAAGMNNSDLQTTYGKYRGYGHQGLPQMLGQEAAGEVEAVGTNVTEFTPGMRVFGHVAGAFAESALGPAAELLPLPQNISFEIAASLPIAYLTAIMALVCKAKLQADEWVLIHPGSGGVGTAATQLAQLLGARVIATASSDQKTNYLRALGIAHVLNHTTQDVVTEVQKITEKKGVQVALDGGGQVTLPQCLAAIANEGRIISYGYTTGMAATLPLVNLIGRNVQLFGIALWYNQDYRTTLTVLRDLVIPAIVKGQVQPTINLVQGLERVSQSLLQMEQNRLMGKVVIVP